MRISLSDDLTQSHVSSPYKSHRQRSDPRRPYGNKTNPSGAFPQYKLGGNITVHNIEDSAHPGDLAGIQSTAGSTLIQSLSYSFDSKGNLKLRHDNLQAVNESFDYDELNRVQHWTVNNSASVSTVRFDYDDFGNRTGRAYEVGGGTTHTYQYAQTNGAGPYAVTGVDNVNTIHYDGEGNQTAGPQRFAGYNAFGLPTDIHSGNVGTYPPAYHFEYDGFGGRVSKTVTTHRLTGDQTVTTLSIGGLYNRTTSSSGTPVAHAYTIVGPAGPIAQVETTTGGSESTPVYVLPDARDQGNVMNRGGTCRVSHTPLALR